MRVNKKPLSRSEKRQAKRTVRKVARGQMKKLRKSKRGVKKIIRDDNDVYGEDYVSKKESKKNLKKLFKQKKDTVKRVKKAFIGGIKSGRVTRK